MYEYEIRENLERVLKKTFKKDHVRYEATLKKIDEIIKCSDLNHYKNLRYGMKEFKRVHVDGSYVLLFSVEKVNKKIIFEDLAHHDDIYRR